MQLVKPSIKFLNGTENPLKAIELAGRTCYKSEDKITEGSAEKFVKMLLDRGHEAMIEHASASYRIVCDRGVTHEIVRHRLFSYAQESTRYCNYKGGVTFIIPPWVVLHGDKLLNTETVMEGSHLTLKDGKDRGIEYSGAGVLWLLAVHYSELDYKALLTEGWTPQQARSVLPNSLKTEIVVTGNLREWRHFFKLRCSPKAHPQMQEVANMILADMKTRVPVIFDDIG